MVDCEDPGDIYLDFVPLAEFIFQNYLQFIMYIMVYNIYKCNMI